MSGRKFDLLVLESLWDNKLGSKTSVKPFFDGLCEHCGIKYVYHTFYDEEDMSYFIKKSKIHCKNFYIAAHGSRNYLHSINNKKIGRESVQDIFKNSRGKGIFFGSCKFVNEENAEAILDYTKADWIAGYKRDVDWFDSTIIDLAYWHYYFKGAENKRIKEKQWEIAPEIFWNYPVSIQLGFSVFDKAQHQKTVNNYLQEFIQNNPDFVKMVER